MRGRSKVHFNFLAILWALFLAADKPKGCSTLVEDPVKLAYCHNCWHPAPLSLCVERKMRRVSGQTEVRSITAHQRTHPVPLEMFDQFDSFKQHNDFCVFRVSPSASSPPHCSFIFNGTPLQWWLQTLPATVMQARIWGRGLTLASLELIGQLNHDKCGNCQTKEAHVGELDGRSGKKLDTLSSVPENFTCHCCPLTVDKAASVSDWKWKREGGRLLQLN